MLVLSAEALRQQTRPSRNIGALLQADDWPMSCLSAFGSSAGQTRRGLENERIVTGRSCHCGKIIVRTAGCGGHGRRRREGQRTATLRYSKARRKLICFKRMGVEFRVEGCECLVRFVQ
jgi:hypothetical protein